MDRDTTQEISSTIAMRYLKVILHGYGYYTNNIYRHFYICTISKHMVSDSFSPSYEIYPLYAGMDQIHIQTYQAQNTSTI